MIDQGNAYNRHNTTSTHSNALTLRWPLIGRSNTGAYFVEPIYQIASVRISKDIAVFNQGDLLALSRLPVPYLIETGQLRAAGVNYNYRGIIGHELCLSLGRREWEKQPSDFSLASGLAGAKSDLFLTAQVETPFGLNFYARTHLDDQRKTGKSEVISKFNFKKYSVDGQYSFLPADGEEQRNDDIKERALSQSVKVGENWQLSNSLS